MTVKVNTYGKVPQSTEAGGGENNIMIEQAQ